MPAEKVRVDLGASGPAPTAATTPATRRWTPRCWRRRSASRCACSTRASRAPAGTRRARPRSTARARRSSRRQGHRLRVHQQGLLAHRREHQRAASRADTLAGQFRGVELKSGDGFGVPAESYEFANKRMAWETIPPLLERASPLRSAHLRDPVGPQIHFASESFIDEVAAALDARPGRVPPATRQGSARHRGDQGGGGEGRLAGAAVAAQATRPATRSAGRGIAYAQRNGTRRRRSSPKSTSTARPARSGRANSRSPTIAARSSTRTGSSTPSKATSCRASAARCGRRSSSTPRT